MLKGQEKIIKKFGKFGETGTLADFDDERFVNNGWWWYSKDPYTWDDNCHTFHEQTLAELYQAINEAYNENNWEAKFKELKGI